MKKKYNMSEIEKNKIDKFIKDWNDLVKKETRKSKLKKILNDGTDNN